MASLYPTSLDTADSLYTAVNGLLTNLTADLSSVATTMSVKATAGAPATGVVTIKGEAIKYGTKTSTSFGSLTRGYDGTSPAQHFNNDEVDFSPIADHHNSLVQAVFALEAKLGTGTGAVKSGANTLSFGTGVPSIVGIVGDVYVRTDGTPGLSTIYYCTVAGNPATFVVEDNLSLYVPKSTLTTDGDLFIRSGGVVSRLGIGTNTQVLTVVGGAPAWAAALAGPPGPQGPPGPMANPMTTTGDIIYSSPGSTPVRLGIGTAAQVLTVSGGVPTWAAAGGGGTGPVSTGTVAVTIPGLAGSGDQKPGAPAASDDEFDTTSAGVPTGWTAFGAAVTSQDTNTSIKSHYHQKQALTAGDSWNGIFKAAPAVPFTVTCKASAAFPLITNPGVGLIISEANPPVKIAVVRFYAGASTLNIRNDVFTTLTGAPTAGTNTVVASPIIYLRLKVTSATNMDVSFSYDGFTFFLLVAAWNPGLAAVSQVALGVDPLSQPVDVAFDWIRFS
jgi:hypothetical protein